MSLSLGGTVIEIGPTLSLAAALLYNELADLSNLIGNVDRT